MNGLNEFRDTLETESRQAVSEILAELGQELVIERRQTTYAERNGVAVFVQFVEEVNDKLFYSAVVTAGTPADPAVSDIEWVLVDNSGKEVEGGRTGRGGRSVSSRSSRKRQLSWRCR